MTAPDPNRPRDITCFFLEPSGFEENAIRIYETVKDAPCPLNGDYHNAELILAAQVPVDSHLTQERVPLDSPLWPTHCSCGFAFTENVHKMGRHYQLYKRSDTGVLTTIQQASAGAMWYATWLEDVKEWVGPDGHCLVVRTPDRDWMVDSRCNNCDSACKTCGVPYLNHVKDGKYPENPNHCAEYVDARPHKCWVRHGTPPNIHVDKNGVTCGAGAGSIQQDWYHAMLHHGVLHEC